ncbi:hypothetical protein AVEN_155234-1 [Araneus ventricosus]|uniref:Uncharacterized protein n=1 Tax=Araneus ventricosus TaxID=182803 RepID=A0A4Y2JR23_ARAVE|nr:hypothetical protein AVEN_155234-1 [Araneus ventricosus]
MVDRVATTLIHSSLKLLNKQWLLARYGTKSGENASSSFHKLLGKSCLSITSETVPFIRSLRLERPLSPAFNALYLPCRVPISPENAQAFNFWYIYVRVKIPFSFRIHPPPIPTKQKKLDFFSSSRAFPKDITALFVLLENDFSLSQVPLAQGFSLLQQTVLFWCLWTWIIPGNGFVALLP